MKVAFIDKKGIELRVESKSLKVNEQKVPLRLLDVIIISSACILDSRDILKITKEGISILLVSARGDNVAMVYSAKSKNAELKMEQYLAQENSLIIAKYFVTQKVQRHTQHLLNHNIKLDSSKLLSDIQKARSLQRLLGLEGSFSNRYFRHYFKLFPKRLHLGKRSKQPPLDPVNAMLSFVYMIVYNLISIKLISYGFEPSIGFLHQPFRSHNALASDFMELFRADINALVFRLFDEKSYIFRFQKKGEELPQIEARRKVWAIFQGHLNPKFPKELDKEFKFFGGY